MSTKEYPVILYGAGDNGKTALVQLNGRGVFPVAFCSRDTARAGEKYGGLPVMSREQVKEKFGNQFRIWITPYSPTREEIENELLDIGFVDKSMIMNPLVNCGGEQYLSCADIRSTVVIEYDRLHVCCSADASVTPPAPFQIPFQDSGKYDSDLEFYRMVVRDFIKYKAELEENIQSGKTCACNGCSKLKKGNWGNYSGKVESLSIGLEFPCQLSCVYCNWHSNARNINKHREELQAKAKKFNIKALIEALELEGMQLNYPIALASGEITIAPQKEEILDCLSKYPLYIFSNCVLYDEQVARLVAREGSRLNVSLDAGTAETYHKVKGLDVFEKVLANVRRYKAEGSRMQVKYILLPENCDRNNIDGFLNYCSEIEVDKVIISRDIFVKKDELPRKILDGAVYMAKQAKQKHLQCEIAKEVLFSLEESDLENIRQN